MSADSVIVSAVGIAQADLGRFARKLARSRRDPTAAQLAELARLKRAVADARARL